MVTPIILAAGASSRLGTPKALLDFEGRSAVSLVVETCRLAGCSPGVVVLGHRAEEVIAAARIGGAEIIIHRGWRGGRTSSLKAGLRSMPGSAGFFLVFPVDCPLVQPGTIAALLQGRASASGRISIVVPRHGGRRGHPVLCDSFLREEFFRLADDEPAHNVIRRDPGRVLELELNDPGVVDNLDTREAYETAISRLPGRASRPEAANPPRGRKSS